MSNIKFETINGTLCRMVEPTPLTDKTQPPFLVRLKPQIQEAMPFVLHCNGLVSQQLFEIIGYPVEDGSHYWALYQMMQGKWVYNPSLEKHKSDKLDARYLHAYGIFGQDIVVKNTLTGIDSILGAASISYWANYAEPSGWQLYEPKPLLADVQVGDLVMRRDGHWAEIIETSGGIEFQPIEYRYNKRLIAVTLNGSWLEDGDKREDDIVEYKPLAPKGTAEWGEQMMLLGKVIISKASGRLHKLNGDYVYDSIDGKEWNRDCSIADFSTHHDKHIPVWQLYTEPVKQHPIIAGYNRFDYIPVEGIKMPEPRPAYKVGDYVRGKSGYDYLIISSPSKVIWSNPDIYDALPLSCLSGPFVCLELSDIERKLSPSEVVVHIGCLSGTVVDAETQGYFRLHNADGWIAIIPLAALDEPTLNLVKKLLEKQGEEK